MVVAITLIIRRKHNKVGKITCLNDQRSNNSEQRNLTEQDLVDGETGENWPLSETRNIAYFETFSGIAPNYKSGSCQRKHQNAFHDAKLCPVPT